MAGDWIKMRIDLQTHPKVVRILSAMRPHDVNTLTDKFRVIGGLHAVWSVFDTHSADGKLEGYTPEMLDHVIGWEGFSNAMISVGWLDFDGAQTIALPEFDEHNGKSGKRRAEDQKRKRNARSDPNFVRNLSANAADENGTREEKRREDISTTPNGVVVDSLLADRRDPCPHQKIIDLYHQVLPMCPQVRDWTPARQQQLRARWNEDKNRQNLDYWRDFFGYVHSCDFLVGRTQKPFFADLEWLTKAQNFVRVREGKYETRRSA